MTAPLPDAAWAWVARPLQIALIDLVLSGDNALVIALVCRKLPQALQRTAMMAGIGGAIVLRFLLTVLATELLEAPGLRLVGALLLVIIAVKFLTQGDDADRDGLTEDVESSSSSGGLLSAILLVVTADLVMGLDNVMALAAVADGNLVWLALGLLFSIPMLIVGSALLIRILRNYPVLVPITGMTLGWIAGQLAVSDVLLTDWIEVQSPALRFVVPGLAAIYVWLRSRFSSLGPATESNRLMPYRQILLATRLTPARPDAETDIQAESARLKPPSRQPPIEMKNEATSADDRRILILFLALFVVGALLLGTALILGQGNI